MQPQTQRSGSLESNDNTLQSGFATLDADAKEATIYVYGDSTGIGFSTQDTGVFWTSGLSWSPPAPDSTDQLTVQFKAASGPDSPSVAMYNFVGSQNLPGTTITLVALAAAIPFTVSIGGRSHDPQIIITPT